LVQSCRTRIETLATARCSPALSRAPNANLSTDTASASHTSLVELYSCRHGVRDPSRLPVAALWFGWTPLLVPVSVSIRCACRRHNPSSNSTEPQRPTRAVAGSSSPFSHRRMRVSSYEQANFPVWLSGFGHLLCSIGSQQPSSEEEHSTPTTLETFRFNLFHQLINYSGGMWYRFNRSRLTQTVQRICIMLCIRSIMLCICEDTCLMQRVDSVFYRNRETDKKKMGGDTTRT